MSYELCVLVIGGHCVGKSTLVRKIIALHGGVAVDDGYKTVTADGNITVAGGGYNNDAINTPGTDRLKEKGAVQKVAGQVRTRIFLAEGFKLSTFGVVPLTVLHQSPKQLVIHLLASPEIVNRGRMLRTGKRATQKQFQKLKTSSSAARKYAQIGVPVITIDVRGKTPDSIAKIANKAIERALE